MSGRREEADVVVVGGGPVGLVGALLLARYGLHVVVFEREQGIFPHPRAVHLDGDAVRLVQALGLWDGLAPDTAHVGGMTFRGARGQELFTLDASAGGDPAAEHGTVFWQPTLERLLRDAIAAEPTARLVTGAEVERIQPASGGALVVAREGPDERHVNARFVLACDGANSPTRRRLGVPLDVLGPSARWLVVDTRVRFPERLPAFAQQFCDPVRPSTYVPGVGRHRRWEFHWPERHEPTADDVRALLARHVRPEHVEVVRASVYRFRSAVVRGWRRGPVLLAGDAAHQMPPFLGQGLASGFRDVRALAWRLALIRAGAEAEPLLETWEAERASQTRVAVRRTATVGRLIHAGAALAALRDASFSVAGLFPGVVERAARKAASHPPLSTGLIEEDPSHAGRLAPPGSVASNGRTTSLDAALLQGFAVLSTEDRLHRASWQALGGRLLRPVDPALERWTAGRAVLLRPDGYAFGSVRPGDPFPVVAALQRRMGHPPSLALHRRPV